MNKNICIFSIFINIILLSILGFFLITSNHNIQKSSTIISSNIKKRRVALMLPVSHPSLEQIANGVMDTLKKDKSTTYEFKIYNGNGNNVLMHAQAEDIFSNNFDLVIPIATTPAQLIKEMAIKKDNKDLPIIFAAASLDVASENPEKINISGVSDEANLNQEMDIFTFLKPSMKNILLVCNLAAKSIELDAQKLEKITSNLGINLKTVAIYQTNELNQKVPPFIQNIDAIIVLKDNTVVSGLDFLVKLCNQNNITLLVSDLDSVEKGAVLGFGVYEYDTGVAAAKLALKVLNEKIRANDIPVKIVDDCKVKVNLAAMKEQNLLLDPKIVFLLKNGETY